GPGALPRARTDPCAARPRRRYPSRSRHDIALLRTGLRGRPGYGLGRSSPGSGAGPRPAPGYLLAAGGTGPGCRRTQAIRRGLARAARASRPGAGLPPDPPALPFRRPAAGSPRAVGAGPPPALLEPGWPP